MGSRPQILYRPAGSLGTDQIFLEWLIFFQLSLMGGSDFCLFFIQKHVRFSLSPWNLGVSRGDAWQLVNTLVASSSFHQKRALWLHPACCCCSFFLCFWVSYQPNITAPGSVTSLHSQSQFLQVVRLSTFFHRFITVLAAFLGLFTFSIKIQFTSHKSCCLNVHNLVILRVLTKLCNYCY